MIEAAVDEFAAKLDADDEVCEDLVPDAITDLRG
jgi:hypothetical protein